MKYQAPKIGRGDVELQPDPFADDLGLLEHLRKELESAASMPPDDPAVKLALAQLYAQRGDTAKSEAMLKSVTGVSTSGGEKDLYVSALGDNIDPNQTWRDARKVLDDIGDQFDSGELRYHPGPSAFHAMDLVALAWAAHWLGEISAGRKYGGDAVFEFCLDA